MFISTSNILPAIIDAGSEVLNKSSEDIGKLIGRRQARLNRELPQRKIGDYLQTGRSFIHQARMSLSACPQYFYVSVVFTYL